MKRFNLSTLKKQSIPMDLNLQATTEAALQNYTVLVVDDDPTNLAVISDYLKVAGFHILVARDGESALKRTQYVLPDIILLNVTMAKMDGFETCRRLKTIDVISDIPVIFMSALANAADKVRGFEVGAVDYITKPIQYEEVLVRVTTHLKIRDLTHSLDKQKTRLEATSQVGQQVASILEVDTLLVEVAKLIQDKFGYYFVGIWLLPEPKETLVLQASAGQAGLNTKAQLGDQIPLDMLHSIVAWVYRTGQSYLTFDVKDDPRYLATKALPNTRSEVAFPLQVRDEVIGVLDIQSNKMKTFTVKDGPILQGLANQIAIAIRNARLYELEKELRQIETEKATELAELNANKDKFFTIISHDLRTPFQALLGNAELLSLVAQDTPPDQIQGMADSIYFSAKNAFDLLDNLLQWSRLQRGKMECVPTHIDLKELAGQSIDLLLERADQKEIQLLNTIQPETMAYIDEYMIDMVLRNLISNALKFTPAGGKVQVIANGSNPEVVEISVADTGMGMSAEDLNKLFKVDVHHSTLGTASEVGTGLGLIMCQEMVEKNGGKIWVESQLNIGTTVKFTAPVYGGC